MTTTVYASFKHIRECLPILVLGLVILACSLAPQKPSPRSLVLEVFSVVVMSIMCYAVSSDLLVIPIFTYSIVKLYEVHFKVHGKAFEAASMASLISIIHNKLNGVASVLLILIMSNIYLSNIGDIADEMGSSVRLSDILDIADKIIRMTRQSLRRTN